MVFVKKFVGEPSASVVPLPPIKHGRVLPVPEKVLRVRFNKGTWDLLPEFKHAFPFFQLEDELFSNERGSVLDAFIGRAYHRCSKKAQAPTADQAGAN